VIRGRARVPFLFALIAISVSLAVTVTGLFGYLAIAAAVVLGQLYLSGNNSRPDRAPIADWVRSRRTRRRDGP